MNWLYMHTGNLILCTHSIFPIDFNGKIHVVLTWIKKLPFLMIWPKQEKRYLLFIAHALDVWYLEIDWGCPKMTNHEDIGWIFTFEHR